MFPLLTQNHLFFFLSASKGGPSLFFKKGRSVIRYHHDASSLTSPIAQQTINGLSQQGSDVHPVTPSKCNSPWISILKRRRLLTKATTKATKIPPLHMPKHTMRHPHLATHRPHHQVARVTTTSSTTASSPTSTPYSPPSHPQQHAPACAKTGANASLAHPAMRRSSFVVSWGELQIT